MPWVLKFVRTQTLAYSQTDSMSIKQKHLVLTQLPYCFTGNSGVNELKPHGSLFTPEDYGTPGCPGSTPGGAAGGVIRFAIGDQFYLDGNIDCGGQHAAGGSQGGGGSGGSIWVEAGRFSGHGLIGAAGGNGDGSSGGGGSGGRAAVYVSTENKFAGRYDVVGGVSGDSHRDLSEYSGGPGTLYLSDYQHGHQHVQLRIDNKNRPWSHIVTLDEKITSYVFDELHLHRKASIHLPPNRQELNLTAHKIVGDRSGFIPVHIGQTLQVEAKEASPTITRTAANFRIEQGAFIVMATTVHIVGQGATAFDWNGRLINVRHLHFASGRKVLVGAHAHTAVIQNNRYLFVDKPGSFQFSTLEFGSNSKITYPIPFGVHFTAGFLVRLLFVL